MVERKCHYMLIYTELQPLDIAFFFADDNG